MNERLFNIEIEGTATVAVQERVENFDAGGGGASAGIELEKGWEARNERRRRKARRQTQIKRGILVAVLLVMAEAAQDDMTHWCTGQTGGQALDWSREVAT